MAKETISETFQDGNGLIIDPMKPAGSAYFLAKQLIDQGRISDVEANCFVQAMWPLLSAEDEENKQAKAQQ